MPKISALPPDTTAVDNDVIPMVDTNNGTTKKITKANLFTSPNITTGLNDSGGSQALAITAGGNRDFVGRHDGWTTGLTAPTSITNNGGGSYSILHPASVAGYKSANMRNRYSKSVAASSQCADFEASSSQSAAKTSPTGLNQTDDLTFEGWIKLESYGTMMLLARTATPGTTGWRFYIESSGLPQANGAARYANAYQRLHLNRWHHVAMTLDMSAGAATFIIDGVLSSSSALSGAGASWTADGDLTMGRAGASNYFDGKASDFRLWSTVRTETQVRANMSQALVGNESGLIGYWKLNGNFNDSTSNANNLTASGATATNADTPFGASTAYSITQSISSDGLTETVQVPYGYTIPTSGGISAMAYSVQEAPYDFPLMPNTITKSAFNPGSVSLSNTSQNLASSGLILPLQVFRTCQVIVSVDLVVFSTTDFEFQPEIRVDGTAVKTLTPSAAYAGSRANYRGITWTVELEAGARTISAGVNLGSSGSPSIQGGGAALTVIAPSNCVN